MSGISGGGVGVPAGTVAAFAKSIPAGWLLCNGAAVNRTLYAALFNEIGTDYGAGNGSTTFNIPDLRGEFVRGLDDGRGVDSGRALGSAQADELKSHKHVIPYGGGSGSQPGFDFNNAVQNYNTDFTGGDETRPRNVAMRYCIKY